MRLGSFLLLALALPVIAAANEVASTPPPAIQAVLKELLGPESVKQVQINSSPIADLYEVVAESYIFYITSDGQHILRGDILKIKKNEVKNLTEERRNSLRITQLNQIKKEDMIIFPAKGKTKHVLTIFTDVDCFYCAKIHQEVGKLNAGGIEVRYLAFPRSGIGSPTYKKMVSVWCAKDRQKAITDAKSGKDIADASCGNPIEEEYELGKRLGVSGTPAVILPTGELLPGYAPAQQLIEYLDEGNQRKDAD